MIEDYVTKEICIIKHKEVEELKEEIKELQTCIQNKFYKLTILMLSVLTALVVNLIMMLIKD